MIWVYDVGVLGIGVLGIVYVYVEMCVSESFIVFCKRGCGLVVSVSLLKCILFLN